jgi:hypothetical protein
MRIVVSCGFMLVLAICGGLVYWSTQQRRFDHQRPKEHLDPQRLAEQEKKRQEEELNRVWALFVQPSLALLDNCLPVKNPRTLSRRDKVVVWDRTTNALSPANTRLPLEMQGHAGNELTLAIVVKKINVEVASYALMNNTKKVPGYRVDQEVCLIDRVKGKALGRFTVRGNDPPAKIKRQAFVMAIVDFTPEYGDADGALATWLEHRPVVGQPDPIAVARSRIPGCREAAVPPAPGKVLFWDLERDVPAQANKELRKDRQGKLSDETLTIVFVGKREYEELPVDAKLELKLLMFGVSAHESRVLREKVELFLVSLSEGKALGRATVEGAFYVEPLRKDWWLRPQVAGNTDQALARWVSGEPANPPDGKRP